jgi:carbon-monoxide dehydrogenase medium subunit
LKPLEYHAPRSLDEAVRLLGSAGPGAAPLGGGTDLIIQNRTGRREVLHMVDVKRIPELNVLEFDAQRGLRLGAAVPCAAISEFAPIRRHYPALLEGAELIGSVQIQGRATVGGNVCNGSPAADTICALIVLRALCVTRGAGGEREIAAKDFMLGPGKTALKPGELLVEFRIPAPPANSGNAYLRFIPRNEMDIAVASAAAYLAFGPERKICREALVAIGAVGPTPILVEKAGQALIGTALDEAALKAAGQASREAARPINDLRGTVEYRRQLADVLTRRAIALAFDRFQERT